MTKYIRLKNLHEKGIKADKEEKKAVHTKLKIVDKRT